MLMGIRLPANPTPVQRLVISQWMGCSRFTWNAKCDENRYLSSYARKYLPVGSHAPINQTYSQYKDNELSPWLSDCPSQILRNSAGNWYETYQRYLKGECGKPKRKKKSDSGSIHLTSELFKFEQGEDGTIRLFIGSKTNNIGYLTINNYRDYKPPKSIYIKKRHGKYTVSFCYDDGFDESSITSLADNLSHLKGSSQEFLDRHTVGIDRGIVRPIQAGSAVFDLTPGQKRNKNKAEKYKKRYQRQLARQKKKGSNRRYRTKKKISRHYEAIANIRKDFCHKSSHAIVANPDNKVLILEDLKVSNMTRKPKAKQTLSGRWEKNGASAKAGLNRAILDIGWYQVENFLKYKSHRAGKALFKVPAHYTSQECAACSHTHPDNRKNQSMFSCGNCGHADNADHNAAEVIKKRAIVLILDSGTELSKRGVLLSGTGRGATHKTGLAKASRARGNEASKKKRTAAKAAKYPKLGPLGPSSSPGMNLRSMDFEYPRTLG